MRIISGRLKAEFSDTGLGYTEVKMWCDDIFMRVLHVPDWQLDDFVMASFGRKLEPDIKLVVNS